MAECYSTSDPLGRVQSLVRAFGILDLLGNHEDGLGLVEVARRSGLAKATAHRLLTTMGALNYVQYDSLTTRWSVGMRAFAVGSAFARARDMRLLGRPHMRSLMLEAHETVNIAEMQDGLVKYVGQVEALNVQPTFARPGLQLPLHSTAVGKSMIAFWSAQRIDGFLSGAKLRPTTSQTITAADRLSVQFQEIRNRGFALDDEENVPGTRCIAAPIFDEHADPVASISISGSVCRITDDRLPALGRTLRTAAARITDAIGGRIAA